MKSNRYIKLSLVVYLYFFSKICAGKVIFSVPLFLNYRRQNKKLLIFKAFLETS